MNDPYRTNARPGPQARPPWSWWPLRVGRTGVIGSIAALPIAALVSSDADFAGAVGTIATLLIFAYATTVRFRCPGCRHRFFLMGERFITPALLLRDQCPSCELPVGAQPTLPVDE